MNKQKISLKDKEILKGFAQQVAKIAADPIQQENADIWTRHNDLERIRPMVLAFPEGSWRELLPEKTLSCKNGTARWLEYQLRSKIYIWEHLRDDNVIDDTIACPIVIHNTGWGLDLKRTNSDQEHGAFHIDPVIIDESDADKLKIPEVTVDWQATEENYQFLKSIFDGILPVEKRGPARGGICPLDTYSQYRGIDNMFMDLIDNPDLIHRVVGLFVDGHISMTKSLENQGVLSLGNTNNYAGSGGNSYTKQLPQKDFDGKDVRTIDQWGFATAQIFSEVSPDMHEEFAIQHEKRYLDMYGLNCYGCCEPLHLKLESLFKHIPRLRRISISPWADIDISSEKLEDKYIFSYKPNPADLANETWEPDRIRQDLINFCERTKGNIVEIIMKDTHTIRHDPQRFWDWVKIAKEVAAEF